MKKKIVYSISLLIVIFCFATISAQQVRSVSGIVTTFRKIPVNVAKVYALKSGGVTYTDSLGRFSIECNEKDMLNVSAAGFVGKKVKVQKEPVLKIDLTYIDNIKNFSDAVGHGHVSEDVLRKALTDQESGNKKDYSKYKSIYELISSEIYSVKVEGSSIQNRKVKSFDDTPDVLLVVDDKIVKDISYINPAYVKSIEFVDDVSATIYGSMGANGVLKITLK